MCNNSIGKDIILEAERLTREAMTKPTEFIPDIDLGAGRRGYILDGEIKEYHYDSWPESISLHTLDGLVDFIKNGDITANRKLVVVINSPTCVRLTTTPQEPLMHRTILALITPVLPEKFAFGLYQRVEDFVVGLQTKFVHDADWQDVIECCTGLKKVDSETVDDNGVSQEVTVQSGVSLAKNKRLKNPCTLSPYRTFAEIEQVSSLFAFRAKDCEGEVALSLHEADGGKWQLEAVMRIKAYLDERLKDCENVLILA